MKKCIVFLFSLSVSIQLFGQNKLESSGNIGVGTLNPDQKITIKGGGIGFDHNSADKMLYSPQDGVLEWMTNQGAYERGFSVSHQGERRVYLNVLGNSYLMGGNVGIGTQNPAAELEVNGRLLIKGANLDPNGGLANLSYLSNTGKLLIGWNRSSGMGETNFISNQGPGGSGGFSFYNYDNSGSMRLLMLMNGNGNIGIGTNPVNEKLAVDGKIKAKEIIVTDMGWADYVFLDAYKPLSLKETEKFIIRNKHLPGIPSAVDVGANGIKVGEMQAKLLEKIEELTLHLIAQEKRMDLQEKEIQVQKRLNRSLLNKQQRAGQRLKAFKYSLKTLPSKKH